MSNPVPLCCTVSNCDIACPEWCACLPVTCRVSFTISNERRQYVDGNVSYSEVESWTFSNIRFDRDSENCVMFSRGGARNGTVSYSYRETFYAPIWSTQIYDPTCPHVCHGAWVETGWRQGTAPSVNAAANAITIFCADPCNSPAVKEFMFLKSSMSLVTNFTFSDPVLNPPFTSNTLADLIFISPLACITTGSFAVRGLRITHYDSLFPLPCIGLGAAICKGTCDEGWVCQGFSAPYTTIPYYELGFDVSTCLEYSDTDCHSCFSGPMVLPATFTCECNGTEGTAGWGSQYSAWHREHSVSCLVP